MQPEDAELVASSVKGNLAAFSTIVERYQTQVFNVAARILGNRASAEDSLDEHFRSPSFQPASKAKSPEQHAVRGELAPRSNAPSSLFPQARRPSWS